MLSCVKSSAGKQLHVVVRVVFYVIMVQARVILVLHVVLVTQCLDRQNKLEMY